MLTAVLLTVLAGAAEDRAQLLDGVDVLERHGIPGTLCVFGQDAFAVLTADDPPEPVVAAARFGKGRVVAWAHGAYLDPPDPGQEDGGAARSFRNALRWAGGGEHVRVGLMGEDFLGPTIEAAGHEVSLHVEPAADAPFDVLVWMEGAVRPEDTEAQEALREYVRRGGGLLCAVCPWGFEQLNERRGRTLRDDLSENAVLRPMGLVFADGYAEATVDGGFAVAASRPDDTHAGKALDAILREDDGASARAYLVVKLLRSLPLDDTSFRPRLADVLGTLGPDDAPRPDHPLHREDALARLRVSWASDAWRGAAPEDVRALPGADVFPGAVPSDAERVTRTVQADPEVDGWQNTGLYLAAGDVLTITADGRPRGWSVRIGCHSDRLWNKAKWRRWPEISRRVALEGRETRVATPFGGTVYLQRKGRQAAAVTLTLTGAVEAPRFVLGDPASEEAWHESREAPGPWAEIEGRNVVLSVPSTVVREWDDPAPLAEWWDSVLASHCRLAGTPLPARRERFVPDAQISAGYMHSGYPIMTQLDVVTPDEGRALPPMLDLEKLVEGGMWGPFHELGHNRQRPAWTFGGTGEVTCNLFTLYTMESVVGIEPWRHWWLEEQKENVGPYFEDGAPFERWRRKPGLALITYAEVQRAFGWEPFEATMKAYEEDEDRPAGDPEAIDTWVRRLSLATGRDLRPFHARWGWPLGDALLADPELDALPVWEVDPTDLESFDAMDGKD